MNATRPAGRRTVAPIANPHADHRTRGHGPADGWRSGHRRTGWRDETIPAEIWLSFLPPVRHYPR
jgi:hypothetical protein